MAETRYISQIRLPEIGQKGQERLKKSSILIVGCGALGSPLAMYLAGSGVGNITLADFDTIDISNLHRQIFYKESEIGRMKAMCLKSRISDLNSEIKVAVIPKLITDKMLHSLSENYDFIIDAADNPATTYLLDEYCKSNKIPMSTAGVSGWKAQIFTFIPESVSFSDIFPAPDQESGILPCSLMGIIGPTASFAASLQAVEVLKGLLHIQTQSQLIYANLLDTSIQVINPR